MRRRLVGLVVVWPLLAACSDNAGSVNDPQARFRRVGVILVVDAIAGVEMKEVMFYDDQGQDFYASSLVSRHVREVMALGSQRVPLTVRAVWREGTGWDDKKKIWNEGKIVGDYTVPVAARIPDEVLASIRANGGGLRLKFRLKPDGVLFGWDIERDGAGTGHVLKFDMPGGDFLETRY